MEQIEGEVVNVVILGGGRKSLQAASWHSWSALDWLAHFVFLMVELPQRFYDRLRGRKPPMEGVQGWDIRLANGERCTDRVIRAVRGCKYVGQILLAGDDVPEGLFDVDRVAPAGRSFGQSLVAGHLFGLGPDATILYVCADLPLAKAEELDAAIEAFRVQPHVDTCITYIRKDEVEAQHKDWPRRYVRFWSDEEKRHIQLCSGGIGFIRVGALNDVVRQVGMLERNKKNPLAIAWSLGLRIPLLLLTGQCTLDDVTQAFRRTFKLRFAHLKVTAGLGHDIDDWERLQLTNRHIAKEREEAVLLSHL